jgi:hypothetical protein
MGLSGTLGLYEAEKSTEVYDFRTDTWTNSGDLCLVSPESVQVSALKSYTSMDFSASYRPGVPLSPMPAKNLSRMEVYKLVG